MPSVRTSEVVCGCLQTWKGCGRLWDVVLEPNRDTTNPAEQREAELSVQLKLGGDETPFLRSVRRTKTSFMGLQP